MSAPCSLIYLLEDRLRGDDGIGVQMQRFREPRRDDRLDRFLAPVVEVVAVGNNSHVAGTPGAGPEILGGVVFARFLVAADVERRAFDRRGERERVGSLGEAVEVALRADRVPPGRPQ